MQGIRSVNKALSLLRTPKVTPRDTVLSLHRLQLQTHRPFASSLMTRKIEKSTATEQSNLNNSCTYGNKSNEYWHWNRQHLMRLRSLSSSSSASSSENWPLSRVRQQFVEYFVDKHKHMHIKSSPVAPLNDPTLLFTNAGMNQFKPIFLGTVNPTSPLYGLKRAANSQKCIRAGGKHNDLDDVGKDTYHHTFFEMLGTWSFGDYFKREAIDWAYDILVNVYKLPKERLYASYFAGDASLGLPADDEARSYWLQYLPSERILPFDKKANFWEMGETGPCGPCSEIHFDRIGNRDASKLVNMDDPDVIEIWNLVFIQFNRELNGSLSSLPDKHIDTGMGLERLTSILQNRRSNYDIDAFQKIFTEIQRVAGCEPYTGLLGQDDKQQKQPNKDTAMRIIADHIRTLSFAIGDGAYPSNEGRGYVLRRILRRAVRYGTQTLGANAGFFHQLVPVVVDQFGQNYPELKDKQKLIASILHDEEMAFMSMLKRGEKHITQVMAQSKDESAKVISGETAFFLYDTLGFPLDLTQIIAAESGFSVDSVGFLTCMELQKSRSRADTRAKRMIGRDALSLDAAQIADLGSRGVPLTNDNCKYFDGNRATHLEGILTSSGFQKSINFADINANPDTVFGILLTDTPFYSEAGGQVSDSGSLVVTNERGDSVELHVLDTQSYGGYVLHNCVYAPSDCTSSSSSTSNDRNDDDKKVSWGVKCEVVAKVDLDRRKKTEPNHTSTHILNFAIRKVLGNDADQRGSLVSSDKLRFDFSHQSAPKVSEVESIQTIVNEIIKSEQDVFTGILPLQEAMKIPGVRAVFGEAYPDPVRVVSVGKSIQELQRLALEASDSIGKDKKHSDSSSSSSSSSKNKNLSSFVENSVEFCGGTHAKNTRDLEHFVITEEGSISQGVRRISGVTGALAAELQALSQSFTNSYGQLNSRLTQLSVVGTSEIKLSNSEMKLLLESIEALDGDLIQFRNKVDVELWSYVDKVKMRLWLDGLSKTLNQFRNKVMLSKAEESTKEIINLAKNRAQQGLQYLAVEISGIGSDGKMQKKVIDDIRKATSDKMCLFCVFPDNSENKFSIVTVVPEGKNFQAKLPSSSASTPTPSKPNEFSAATWLNQALATVSGRGGGKANLAQGSASDKSQIPALLDLASKSFDL